MAKMSVDLQRGLIEIDGDEKFVERVYADVKDVILGNLANLRETQNDFPENNDETVKAERQPRKRSKSTGPSCASRIEALKSEDFFKDAKTPKQISARLKEKGTIYESKNIAAALISLTKAGKLRRFNDNGWNYQNS